MSEGGEARMRQRWWMSNDRRDEGGEARNHEAEVEAGLRARSFSIAHATGEKRRVVFLDAALDALRRSPQGEDHEAGIQAALNAYHAKQPHETIRTAMERAIAAYLSRCPSPERNTEKLVEALLIVAASNDADLLGDPEDERTWQALDALYKRGLIATRRHWSDEYTTVITDKGREFVREALAEYSSTTKPESRVSQDHDPGRDD